MAQIRSLTLEQLKALLAAVPSAQNRLMILVTFNHGLRASETLALTGKDIHDGFVKVKRLKGSLPTIQPFVQSTDPALSEVEGLTELAQTAGRNERLFPMTRHGFLKLMQRAGARAGIPEHLCFVHVLKHTAAIASIRTAGIENVKQWLGHKNLSSTGAYLRVTDEQAHAAIQGSW